MVRDDKILYIQKINEWNYLTLYKQYDEITPNTIMSSNIFNIPNDVKRIIISYLPDYIYKVYSNDYDEFVLTVCNPVNTRIYRDIMSEFIDIRISIDDYKYIAKFIQSRDMTLNKYIDDDQLATIFRYISKKLNTIKFSDNFDTLSKNIKSQIRWESSI